MVKNWFGLFFCLRLKFGQVKRRTVSKKTSTLSKKDASLKETILPVPVRNFSFRQKKWVHRGKVLVVDMVSLFLGFCIYHLGLEYLFLRPDKFSKLSSFGGGSVRFFLPFVCWGGGGHPNPKDPAVLKDPAVVKILRRSKFTTRSKTTTAQ